MDQAPVGREGAVESGEVGNGEEAVAETGDEEEGVEWGREGRGGGERRKLECDEVRRLMKSVSGRGGWGGSKGG